MDTFLKAVNDRMTGALPSDTVKNLKLSVNPTSPLYARSYRTGDPRSSSNSFKSVNAIQTCFKWATNTRKDQLQVKTLAVNEVETSKSKEPEKALDDEFKDLHLNLPVLAHVPIYDALLDKYIESLELGKNGSAFIQSEMPEKMKEPGLFILPCRLGDSKHFDTLADLGSCVNLIPLDLFKKLNIELLEETEDVLGLADGTKSYPVGIVKNVEVHVGRLKLIEDFHVVDIEREPTCPLLVGRGFLATANAVIDCKKAKIAVEEGITRSIFGVRELDFGEESIPYWTTIGKRKSYKALMCHRGLEYGRYGVLTEVNTAYRWFLGVRTTFDIFQNIHILHRYAVSSLMHTAYWMSEQ
ncbi:RNA-directed DNA polymerase, eukaryota, reverse transcriptase zinc-binding domain protein [Tanacetum coccineum]|uniref:RNA-directed DNA polymerase, eukaryota, reverse transcriptase zinc-binding domain protein n=1 Tax=Tanacetum coccineum TaxID=301880 RepID=A0ABQ5FZ42_9ASTR